MLTDFRIMLIFFLLTFVLATALPTSNDNEDEDQHPFFEKVSLSPSRVQKKENLKSFWNEEAQKKLKHKLSNPLNTNMAKNVILFLGDGMSIPTVAAARMYQGGEEVLLSFDKFPWTGLSMTYAVDKQVSDSANTATAYLGGVKANYGTIGVGPQVVRGDCIGQSNTSNHVLSIAYHSQNANKRTGLVTTARVTDASPAGVYAHIADRNWEDDTKVRSSNSNPARCPDIAKQLVYGETGSRLDVIMGGGRTRFLPKKAKDESNKRGRRSDGLNLIQKWLDLQNGKGKYIWNRTSLLALDNSTEKVLGLFSNTHMHYNLEKDINLEPSLSEMTKSAINILSKGEKGYFLFVEGAKIDLAHHLSQAHLALDETIEFSKAIQTAVDITNEKETLIVVTADHAHTMSYSGYADRGNDIFAFAGKDSDKVPYFTLNYANGPGFVKTQRDGTRRNPKKDNYDDKNYVFDSVAPLSLETHGGDDVAIYARGAHSHLFSGVLEENVIPHFMSYASCVGKGLTACNNKNKC